MLVCIGGKNHVYVVFAIEFVATVVVGDVGDWRERVGEQKTVGLLHHVRIRLHKHKLINYRLVNGNTVETRRIIIAGGIILSVFACIEYGVHEQMRHSVGKRGEHIPKLPVYLPHLQSLGNFLIAGGVGVVLVEVAVGAIAVHVSLVEVAAIVHPRERLGTSTEKRRQEPQRNYYPVVHLKIILSETSMVLIIMARPTTSPHNG